MLGGAGIEGDILPARVLACKKRVWPKLLCKALALYVMI